MTSRIVGYARCSTTDQNTDIQVSALKAAGAHVVFSELKSGTTTDGRKELEKAIDCLLPGDVLLVTRLDRLTRSLVDMLKLVETIAGKGASLKATEQAINSGDASGKLFLSLLGSFAEFETAIRKERQLEGTARAKSNGVYAGRKQSIDRGKVKEMHSAGKGPSQIADTLGCSRMQVYRLIRELGLQT